MALTKERLAAIREGDTLVMCHNPFHLRKGENRCPHKVLVTSVGRKYFSVVKPEYANFDKMGIRFTLSDGIHSDKDFSGRYLLFDTMGDYNRQIELEKYWDELQGFFRNRYSMPNNLTTEKIKDVLEILKSE